jgi:phosphoribosylformylglycinamidine synthase
MVLGVVQFPDFDCSKNLIEALSVPLNIETRVFTNNSISVKGTDVLLISGGTCWLSYCKQKQINMPVIEAIFEHAEKNKYIFGFGEGFRLLCKLKLLPGWFDNNINGTLISRNVYLKVDNSQSALTCLVDKSGKLKIPLSVKEGCYKATGQELMEMHQNKQILFRYCDQHGKVTEKVNYTGSADNIAAICNINEHIFGILPSPERAANDKTGNTDGRYILESILSWVR